MNMAKKLIESMSGEWDPEAFKDDYRERLEKVVAEKIQQGGKNAPRRRRRTASRPM